MEKSGKVSHIRVTEWDVSGIYVMLMLTGEYEHTLDDKNRLFVSNKLRSQIDVEQHGSNFYLVMGANGILCMYPEKYFKEIVISGDIGVAKPDPKIFKITLDRIGVQAEQAIMVGNSLSKDVKGAQDVGMKAVWINRNINKNETDIKPDYEIRSINKLDPILRDLE